MEDEMVEVPNYFICPISLQIMKDPVTAITGITYDRDSIEYWLATADEALCPVTKQPLQKDSDLTPNHTLRRLIQAWCVTNASRGIDRIPTPKSPLSKSHVLKLLRNLKFREHYANSLLMLDLLAHESEKNRKCLAEAGTSEAMVSLIVKSFKESQPVDACLGQAIKILHLMWNKNLLVKESHDLVDSLIWVLKSEKGTIGEDLQTLAMVVLKLAVEGSTTSVLERLKLEFFDVTMNVLRKRVTTQAVMAAIRVLINVCPSGRNRMKIVEAGAVFELLELEMQAPERNVSELVFSLLAHLCSCADGRAQLLKHACGIPLIAKRMLRVSPGIDDRAVHILTLIARFSATDEVVGEMMRGGAVTKLCMVLHADSEGYLKKKAREVLRLHSHVWSNSPCFALYLLPRYAR